MAQFKPRMEANQDAETIVSDRPVGDLQPDITTKQAELSQTNVSGRSSRSACETLPQTMAASRPSWRLPEAAEVFGRPYVPGRGKGLFISPTMWVVFGNGSVERHRSPAATKRP